MANHKVGATVEGLRVPNEYEGILSGVSEAIRLNDSPQHVLGALASLLSQHQTTELLTKETHNGGLFKANSSNFETRFQPNLEKVRAICETMKMVGHQIVLTSGTFDIIHIGHAGYIEKASEFGDFLVVGVDSDEKVKQSKGPTRPVVNERERLGMLAHLRGVGLLTLKNVYDAKWQLIRTVKPDTLIATEGTYDKSEISQLEDTYVGRVVVLPPQATTSTTARLRTLQLEHGAEKCATLLDGVSTLDIPEESKTVVLQMIRDTFGATYE
jgi:D-glycero-beta-D-manno-heptose 1-phosphate adenylyltransferase